MRPVLLGIVWLMLVLKGVWFALAFAVAGWYGKLSVLLAIWALTAAAAASFMKLPVMLPILATLSLVAQLYLLDSWDVVERYPSQSLSSNLAGIVLAVAAWSAFRYRPVSFPSAEWDNAKSG